MTDHDLRKRHADGLQSGYTQHLMGLFDQTAAIFGLEQRYPFFDRRLIEFCLALPFEQKLRDGWTRSILRRAMQDILPPDVQWRTDKGNQSITIRQRLVEERACLDAVILKDPDIIDEYIDITALRAAYDRYLSDPLGASEDDLFTIFLSVNLARWLRRSAVSDSARL